MKHTLHIVVLIVFNVILLLPVAVLGDESASFQNFGSVVDSASPSAMNSDNYSAQDTGMGWRTSNQESGSYQTDSGGTEIDSGSDSGGSDSGGGGSGGSGSGGDDGGGGGGGGRRPPTVVNAPSPAADTPPLITLPVERPRPQRPVRAADTAQEQPRDSVGVVSGERVLPAATHAAATPGVLQEVQDRLQDAAAVFGGFSPFMRKASETVAAVESTTTGQAWISIVDAGMLLRLARISAIESSFEAIPAYASSDSLSSIAGFALRPGSVEIGMLVPFIGRKGKKRRSRTRR